MGIGRREFIRLTGLALAGVAPDPLKAVVTTEDVYINKKLGLMFNKPREWGFVALKDFGKIKEDQILNGEWNLQKDEVFESLGEPVCIVTKYPLDLSEYKGVFSPTITVHVTPKSEFEEDEFESFEELMSMSAYGASLFLKDFQIIDGHSPYVVSGSTFYEYDATYSFEHVDLNVPLKVELKVIKVEQSDFYYDFNCHQSIEANQIAGKEFEYFKNSIRLI